MRPAVQMAASAEDPEDTGSARVATRALSLEHGSVRRARDFTHATLRRWGLASLSDDIGVVVSELLTNALRHACKDGGCDGGWPIRLGLLCPGSCLLCAVGDPSAEIPVMREPDYLAETGRGLHVVASLSDSWGWTVPGQDGKVVWALFVPRWRLEEAEAPGPQVMDGMLDPVGAPAADGTAVGSLRA